MARRWLNPERLVWLVVEYPKRPVDETVALFNAEFGTDITKGQMRKAQEHRFPGVLANGGRRPPHVPNKGCFKPGSVPANIRPMYSERFQKGAVLIKVPGPSPFESLHRQNTGFNSHWVAKARWVWEKEHGPIPDGHAVIHRDGDPWHNELDNLICVPRGVLAILNRHSVGKGPKELEPTRIQLAIMDYERGRRARESA